MTVYETDLPGVGRKFELERGDGSHIVVVLHHDGRREVFERSSPDADSERLFDLDSEEAGQLATVLQGSTFETVDTGALSVPLGGGIIEWIEITEGSPLDGATIGESDIRSETGVSVVALQRGEETIANPDADVEIAAGDVIVGIGTREEHAALEALA